MKTDSRRAGRYVLMLAAVGGLAAGPVGCGDDEENGGDGAATPTTTQSTAAPTVAATGRSGSRPLLQLTATAAALDRTAALYAAGDRQRALDEAGKAYVDHFEQVEPALERANEELNEDLEKKISTGLRDLINRNAPVAQVQAHVTMTKTEMRQAFTALGGKGRPPF